MSLLRLNGKSYSTFLIIGRGIHGRCRIGNRDWVGFGHNGSANYKDDAHFPFPAIRFKENTRDICALREKEKGDWRMLCCEEKKALYRASFCQTFAEFQHPTGQWKAILGGGLFLISFTFWTFIFLHYYVFEPLPASLSNAAQKVQLRRMLELRVNPIDGLSSKWDYDKDRWKVALVLALIGLVVANPVPPLGLGLASPIVVPSYSVSSSLINHGVTIPRVVVSAPVIRHVVSAPIVTAPIIRTPVITAPVSVGYGGLGWGSSIGGWGSSLGGWGGYGWGKGWH